MYAIVRADLCLTNGGRAAQAGHAFLKSFLTAPPAIVSEYNGPDGGTKVVLTCRDERELCDAFHKAKLAGLPCAMHVEDDAQPPFVGAVGIGPCTRAQAKHITGAMPLMK